MTGLTVKGRATRDRIVEAASGLMLARGVTGTTMDEVRAAAGVSSSQIYHYFTDKHALVRAVVGYQTDAVVGGQEPVLAQLRSLAGLRLWRDVVVDRNRLGHSEWGCPLGSLGSQLSETDPVARGDVAAAFLRWQAAIHGCFLAMRASGELRADINHDDLALATLAALQGGLLLAQVQRRVRPLEVALDAALDYVALLTVTA